MTCLRASRCFAAQSENVVGRLLGDRVDLLLLLGRGIDRPSEPLHAALDRAREEHAAAAHVVARRAPAVVHRRTVPALATHRAGHDGADHAAGEQQGGRKQDAAQAARLRRGLNGDGGRREGSVVLMEGSLAWRGVLPFMPYLGAGGFGGLSRM